MSVIDGEFVRFCFEGLHEAAQRAGSVADTTTRRFMKHVSTVNEGCAVCDCEEVKLSDHFTERAESVCGCVNGGDDCDHAVQGAVCVARGTRETGREWCVRTWQRGALLEARGPTGFDMCN